MCTYMKCILKSLCILIVAAPIHGWDSAQLEIFDLVEEINENFYTVLNVSQDADLQSIKKSFRSLSLLLHPDKNDAPDAEVQFRNLVAVYDVLKDNTKRDYYNEVLRNGLPNWKSAVYYYRHVRKMGLAETLCTLFVVVTIGQYLVAWGAYLEKKYTAEQVYGAKIKKLQKKRGQVPTDIIEKLDIPKPSFRNTLPIQIPKLLWAGLVGFPAAILYVKHVCEEEFRKKKLQEQQQPEEKEEEEVEKMEKLKSVRKRKPGFVLVEREDGDVPTRSEVRAAPEPVRASAQTPQVSGGLWTDDDLSELIHLVRKYPGGTGERWDKIAEAMNRSVTEVTYMAAKLKENCYRLPGQDEPKPLEDEAPKKPKTKGGKHVELELGPKATEQNWSQLQQKALETALAKYPKGPADRWDKIAKCVPNKTKEECMLRYRYLVEFLKKQKEEKKKDDEDAHTSEPDS